MSEGRPWCRWTEEATPADSEPGVSTVATTRAEESATLVDARAVPRPSTPAPFVRVPWTANLADLNFPVLKGEKELRRLWGSVPPRTDQRVLVAARHWREAAHAYFVARLLGYSVQILDGSVEDLAPLERGP